ncbi:bile acid:sodium symporter family protein [Chelativorans salis]|uniref:Bile acid:sodium symporter family protein n=1 Tax=Chelativorans salis TaxID=2978478 RepID=A0ABT2LQ25_9HYPH|nr:bile acid:sodium symporter family protein [Chelativorans sp. EGI FJ00035]MCT7375483.1 bile acid:sodium symporter family protein [Chelativorans sp. EGI FJ00035]
MGAEEIGSMQSNPALNLGLPIALVIIMLGLGLSLKLEDFKRILSRPKPILIGIVCQAVILPAFCLVLVYLSDLPPAISVGMMLLSASPGATSATLYTHLARGDVALSITFAAVTSVLVLISLPIVANVSLLLFYGETETVSVGIDHILQIFALAVVPAMIGMFIHSRYPAIARRLDRPVKALATFFLAAIVIFALVSHWGLVVAWGPVIGATALVFNLVSFAVGYFAPLALGVERRQTIALAMSIGIHNAALVITLALSQYMLNNPEMAIPPALYGVIAYITGGVFVWMLNRRSAASDLASR